MGNDTNRLLVPQADKKFNTIKRRSSPVDLLKHGCPLQVVPPLLRLSCLSSGCLARTAHMRRIQAPNSSANLLLQACGACLGPQWHPSLWQVPCRQPWLLQPCVPRLLVVLSHQRILCRAARLQLVCLRWLQEGHLSTTHACLASLWG